MYSLYLLPTINEPIQILGHFQNHLVVLSTIIHFDIDFIGTAAEFFAIVHPSPQFLQS